MTISELSKYRHYKREAERLRLRTKLEIVTDTVSGSSPEFPYTKHASKIEGVKQKHQRQLDTAYIKAYTEQIKLEEFIQTVDDPLVREIIRLRFEDGLKWEQVAIKIGGGNSSSGLIMKIKRYLQRC